jgi:hypothetical protein
MIRGDDHRQPAAVGQDELSADELGAAERVLDAQQLAGGGAGDRAPGQPQQRRERDMTPIRLPAGGAVDPDPRRE